MRATATVAIDHSRGLCHKPDTGTSLPLEKALANPPKCRCCGNPMRVVEDSLSTSFQQLGMYEVVCDFCTSQAG